MEQQVSRARTKKTDGNSNRRTYTLITDDDVDTFVEDLIRDGMRDTDDLRSDLKVVAKHIKDHGPNHGVTVDKFGYLKLADNWRHQGRH
jgi:hypothetical protein